MRIMCVLEGGYDDGRELVAPNPLPHWLLIPILTRPSRAEPGEFPEMPMARYEFVEFRERPQGPTVAVYRRRS